MKTKYTFPVISKIKLVSNDMFPINYKGGEYQFILNNDDFISKIEVVVNCPDEYFPALEKKEEGLFELKTNNPIFGFILVNLRGMEASMSIYGIESINTKNYSIQWIPENENEKKLLKINNFKTKVSGLDYSEFDSLSFDLAARSILASWNSAKLSTVASFFRKGTGEMITGDYISAIFSFYLIFESGYGNGKWRGYQVKQEYEKSKELKNAFTNAIFSDEFRKSLGNTLTNQFNKSDIYSSKDFSNYFSHFIDLRGSLQHHNLNDPKAWNPLNPEKYELDATIMSQICFHLVSPQLIEPLFDEKIINEFVFQRDNFIKNHH